MTESERYIVSLTRAAVFDTEPQNPPDGADYTYIYDKALEQNISGLLASAILRLPKDSQPQNAEAWRKIMMQTMLAMSVRFAEFERMMKILLGNKLFVISLKGAVVRGLYPVPEMRTMGDFDVLLKKSDRRAVEELFRENGYTLRRDTLFTEAHKGGVCWELFISLESEFKIKPSDWDNELRRNTVTAQNGIEILSPTYALIYTIVHMAKHLLESGCGIRALLDAVLIMEKCEIDYDKVYEACSAQGYEQIYACVMLMAKQYYGIDTPEVQEAVDCEGVLDYMLNYGIFGYTEDGNVLLVQSVKRGGEEVGAIRRMFFPPLKMIWHKYRYLKKAPFLLPVAWIHRLLRALFVKKYSISKMAGGVKGSLRYSREHDKRLEELGLRKKQV